VDGDGVEREFLKDYFDRPTEMLQNIFLKGYEWPFGVRKIYGSSYIDLLVYHESVILGRDVYMDFRREPWGLENGFDALDEVSREYLKNSDALIPLPIERLRKMNPRAIALYMEHGIDLTQEPLRVAVCAQHNNGGVRIDANWQTSVGGLYAVGEAAGSLGIFRPGGSALNSCQVGSMRAAEHIVYQSENKVSERFEELLDEAVREADALIARTKSDRSTLKETRRRYAERMSRSFAFLRDIPSMTEALEQIGADETRFAADNQWREISEIPALFKNLDILSMQQAVGSAMLYTAKQFGSRGSSFVLNGEDFMARCPVEENVRGRGQIVTLRKRETLEVSCVDVRPIPERDLWFERVWNQFNQLRG
jgi:succinate dehydrogenase/fumarate reductase flavoprotein subunit